MTEIRVFISYSHDSDAHAARVRGLGASLIRDGCDCRIDVYKDSDEDWPAWMTNQLLEADFVLCVITATYERRFRDKETPDQGLGVGWEAGLIRRLLYAKKLRNDRIFPLIFEDTKRARIPIELTGFDCFLLDRQRGYEALLRKVLNRPLHVKPEIGSTPNLEASSTTPLFARPGEVAPAGSPMPLDIHRITRYAPKELIGREAELEILDSAWKRVQQNQIRRAHVLSFIALGGEGKTSLIAHWLAQLAERDLPDCEAVFAWSFYSQGTQDQAEASADLFLREALIFFGDRSLAESPQGAFEKGRGLANLVAKRRALLVLDGLEPLQYAPGTVLAGQLKDPGLTVLLKDLAARNRGLVIVTSRETLADLHPFSQTSAPEIQLIRLSRAAGVRLLKTLGVKGSDARTLTLQNNERNSETVNQFEKLVEEVQGHALTLTIFGAFLDRAFGGDIRRRDRVQFDKADAKIQGGHAFRTMAAYEQWLLRDGGEEGPREVAVLRLMGLFDRPADAGCLQALRREVIPGLTEALNGLAEDDWDFALSALEDAHLLGVNRDPSGQMLALDAHPLLREYFAKELREKNPKAYRRAHQRLFEYLCASTKEGQQPSLGDLQPLYQAVAHGCAAGLPQEACEKVYRDRILRGTGSDGFYSTKKLGAIGADLGAVACFFEVCWNRVSPLLSEPDRAWLLNEAALRLRALGRLGEAREPMRISGEMDVKVEQWKGAAISYSNLSELEVTLGDLGAAIEDAEQSVLYADRSGDGFFWMVTRTTHADALHQSGRLTEAEELFREAEKLQGEFQPEYPLLYAVQGFRYCDLLLAQAERAAWRGMIDPEFENGNREFLKACRAISERAQQILYWATNVVTNASILDIALDHLTLSRAALYTAILAKTRVDSIAEPIELALRFLRRSGAQNHLPRGLLTRAWWRFLTSTPDGHEKARIDLDEGLEIAERGPMPLYQADILLTRARLFGLSNQGRAQAYPWSTANPVTQHPPASPEQDLAEARRLIEKHGYLRRLPELEDAERAAGI